MNKPPRPPVKIKAPESTVMPKHRLVQRQTHHRLNELLRIRELSPVDLHHEIRKRGISGVHGSFVTLRRWLSGEGVPPDYWLEETAKILGVTYEWLANGEGAEPEGYQPMPKPQAPSSAPEPPKAQKVPASPTRAAQAAKEARKNPAPPSTSNRQPWPGERDVWGANVPSVVAHVEKTDDPAEIIHIQEIEKRNPNYPDGGRQGVLRKIALRLEALEKAVPVGERKNRAELTKERLAKVAAESGGEGEEGA